MVRLDGSDCDDGVGRFEIAERRLRASSWSLSRRMAASSLALGLCELWLSKVRWLGNREDGGVWDWLCVIFLYVLTIQGTTTNTAIAP